MLFESIEERDAELLRLLANKGANTKDDFRAFYYRLATVEERQEFVSALRAQLRPEQLTLVDQRLREQLDGGAE